MKKTVQTVNAIVEIVNLVLNRISVVIKHGVGVNFLDVLNQSYHDLYSLRWSIVSEMTELYRGGTLSTSVSFYLRLTVWWGTFK